MPLPSVSPLPTAPSRADLANFPARADAFFSALPTFATQMNAVAAAVPAQAMVAPWRNRIINGNFDVNQRGITSQTSAGYGVADRWFHSNFGSTKTTTLLPFPLGQTSVPGQPSSYVRTVVSSVAGAGNYVVLQHRIENVRTLAGQSCRLTFWARGDAARPIAVDLRQSFGTGGTPSAEVSGIGAQKFTLSSGWQKFSTTIVVPSVSGKTAGTAGDSCLELTFWFDAGANWNSRTQTLGQQSGTFDISRVQLEPGSVETEFEARTFADELHLCQRFFYAGLVGGAAGSAANANYIGSVTPFPVTMRGVPAVTFSDLAGTANRISTANGNGFQFSAGTISAGSAGYLVADALTTAAPGHWWRANFTASAELLA